MTSTPVIARTRDELDAVLKDARSPDAPLAFVPTMGAMHAGHEALLREGRQQGETLVASIFVNPTQFGPGEDLSRYPRTFDADLAMCAREGADVVFAPEPDQVYRDGDPLVTVDPGPLGGELEGRFRPTHFRGVLTVVAKLFGLVRPDVAVFGQKDYQQLVLVRRMVRELALGTRIVGVETVREFDGLALSSRNAYLSPDRRRDALGLSHALRAGVSAAADGRVAVLKAAGAALMSYPGLTIDYLELRSPDLASAPEAGEARLLIAGRVGAARLIDNLPLTLGDGSEE
ncbi:MAG: pantoate--beta-alanine ligase [Propionibacteriales bacterium]|nr:pantoate--beta-alanine ligase [Propionibacteriales bacterium]